MGNGNGSDHLIHGDGLLRATLLDGQARALLCDSTVLCETARATHALSRVATAALGRLLTVTAMMSSAMKGEGESMTATVKGSGPLGTLMAVGQADGSVKGYADHPEVELAHEGAKLPVGEAVGRDGRLTVIKDLGMREPYIGQVRLVSGEIAEDFAMYFTASEQTPSLVSLGVLVKDRVIAAGGLIVQMLPGAGEDAVRAIEAQAPAFSNISATIRDRGLDGALESLLRPLRPEVLARSSVRYLCDCSRERIERALLSMGAEELRDMIREQHGAEVDCHFCNRRWRFTEAELTALLERACGKADQ